MARPRFLDVAIDPALVPGIYNTCDQWCHYCPATDRCLAFKCRPDAGEADPYVDIEERMYESMQYLNDCYEAEGLQPPQELLLLLNGDRPSIVAAKAFVPVDDALERMGKRYAVLVAVFLASSREPLPANPVPKREYGPTPVEVVLYYHVRIASKIYRAIASSLEAARTGSAAARWDSDVSAKVALIAMERSDEALQVIALDDADPRIEHMRKHLSRLGREVAARFPAARTLVRPGLDLV